VKACALLCVNGPNNAISYIFYAHADAIASLLKYSDTDNMLDLVQETMTMTYINIRTKATSLPRSLAQVQKTPIN
jgi:hypothetical protein